MEVVFRGVRFRTTFEARAAIDGGRRKRAEDLAAAPGPRRRRRRQGPRQRVGTVSIGLSIGWISGWGSAGGLTPPSSKGRSPNASGSVTSMRVGGGAGHASSPFALGGGGLTAKTTRTSVGLVRIAGGRTRPSAERPLVQVVSETRAVNCVEALFGNGTSGARCQVAELRPLKTASGRQSPNSVDVQPAGPSSSLTWARPVSN